MALVSKVPHPLAIDITRLARGAMLGRRPTGIDRVTLAYIRHFAPRAHALLGRERWVIELGAPLSRRVFARLGPGGVSQVSAGPSPLKQFPRFLLHTGHSGLESAAYLTAVRRRGLLPVFLVHDVIPITHPEFSRPGIPERHLRRMHHAAHAAAGLICNSEATRSAMMSLFNARGWPMPPSVVAYLGVEVWVRPPGNDSRASLSEGSRPYFVCVGTLEPRKNHLLLLRVWQALARRMGERTPDLLFIGQRGWMFDELVRSLRQDEVARRHVLEAGDCSDTELRDWLLGARALLMPSRVEGFGLPVAESLGCGVPVIASRLEVYREFAGEVPDYVDADDETRWADLVEAYCEPDSLFRKAQMARLGDWQPPTWPAHFSRVEAFLGNLAEEDRSR